MTQKEFETLFNARRAEKNIFAKHFKLTKRKIIKGAVTNDVVDSIGRPERIIVTPCVSKVVVDTNKVTELYQAAWEFFLGTKIKRISSEGKWRPNVGFIKSTNVGFADLHGLYNGRGVYVEVKQTSEKHLKSQKEFAEWVRSGGGIYVSVRSFDDMYNLIQALINNDNDVINLLGKI